jgi:hypothetical protein
MALAGVEDETDFNNSVGVLGEALGVDFPSPEFGEAERDDRKDTDHNDEERSSGGYSSGGAGSGGGGSGGGGSGGGSGGGGSGGRSSGGSGGGGSGGGSRGGSARTGEGDTGNGTSNRPYWLQVQGQGGGTSDRKPRDDRREKAAVIWHERQQHRRAKSHPDNNPGFDVESLDPRTGQIRRIEIKGMSGVFDNTAAVAISWTQFEMAMENQDENIEYWLYVVDRNRSDNPAVHPIAWARHKGQLKFLFEGARWLDEVERTETSFEPSELDSGE